MNLNLKKIGSYKKGILVVISEILISGLSFAEDSARNEIMKYLCGFLTDGLTIAIVVGVIVALFIGVRYMSNMGSAEGKVKNKEALNDLMIGAAIVALAPFIVPFIARGAKVCVV